MSIAKLRACQDLRKSRKSTHPSAQWISKSKYYQFITNGIIAGTNCKHALYWALVLSVSSHVETIPQQLQMMTTKNELFLLQAGMNEYRTGDNKALAGATRPVALNRPCGAHGMWVLTYCSFSKSFSNPRVATTLLLQQNESATARSYALNLTSGSFHAWIGSVLTGWNHYLAVPTES